ncbi:MAG: hypothetical protein K6T77_04645, partial [candidate division WOR-3 bacterium]|nr:hypothetical protein [candidate division WOR-3 bacterium]
MVLVIAGVILWPSFQLYVLFPKQEKALKARLSKAATFEDSQAVRMEINEFNQRKGALYEKRIVHLGLDLVGGMH